MALPVEGPSGTRGGGASSRGDESCDESVVIDEGAVATAAAAEDFEDAVSIISGLPQHRNPQYGVVSARNWKTVG